MLTRPQPVSHAGSRMVECAFRGAKTQKGNLPRRSGESSCCGVLAQSRFGATDRDTDASLCPVERIHYGAVGQLQNGWVVDDDRVWLIPRSHRLPGRAENRPERDILREPPILCWRILPKFLQIHSCSRVALALEDSLRAMREGRQ